MGVRIGIDVGGTFTKAAAIDATTGVLLGKAATPTTHAAPQGVSEGIVHVFHALLGQLSMDQSAVDLVALSTTQAVNALLEGDVAPVGVIGIGSAHERRNALRRTRLASVRLSPERELPVFHAFLAREELTDEAVDAALSELLRQGAGAVVASAAYGVEDPSPELRVIERAARMGVPATAGHEMSGLYGLEVRTLTAAVNASILPKMVATVDWTESGLRSAGLRAPLLVMQGDLTVTSLATARSRPASTILSGPGASVAGALLYHRMLDGLFIEVGGTSTNIGVVRGGRVATKHVRIMEHPTSLRSLDVRVGSVAGGSMVRVRRGRLADAGPRSAHIAGLPYPTFRAPEDLQGLRLVLVGPRPGDPADYAAVENDRGKRFALTLTDAANALDMLPAGDYARGATASARLALQPLAEHLGLSVDEAAKAMLEKGVSKLLPAVRALTAEYSLREPEVVGLGGAASVLVPMLASRLGSQWRVVPHADVVSSIGVAMSPIGVEVERSIGSADPETLLGWVRAAEEAAVQAGSAVGTVRSTVVPVPERRAVRIRAVGSPAGEGVETWGRVPEPAARELAAKALGSPVEPLALAADTGSYRVYTVEKRSGFGPWTRGVTSLAVVDGEGAVLLAAEGAEVAELGAGGSPAGIGTAGGPLARPRRVAVVAGSRALLLPPELAGCARKIGEMLSRSGEAGYILTGTAVSA